MASRMAPRIPSIPLPEAPRESAVARLLIAPIVFVSFLLSLVLIDNRNASFRHHIHAPSQPLTPDTLFGRVRNTLHSWLYRPQPYGYVKSPDMLQRQKSGEIVHEQAAKEEPWHWNTNQKKMMKMEVADAFEMRKWVVLTMAVAVAVFSTSLVWFVSRAYDMFINYM